MVWMKRLLVILLGPYARKLGRDDKRFLAVVGVFPMLLLVFLVSMLVVIMVKSIPIFQHEGIAIFISNVWRAVEGSAEEEFYGLLSAIWGSVYTATIAVVIGGILSICFAVFVEDMVPPRFKDPLSTLMDVMAALPTIVYGLWAAACLAPLLLEYVYKPLHQLLGWTPFFSFPPKTGYTLGTAGVLLGIMITPYAAAMIREAYSAIPLSYVEAIYSIGATKLEAIRLRLGMIKPAIIAALVLGFGRAVGETVAVALVVGNSLTLTLSLTSPGTTVASLIANMFASAPYYTYMESALFAGGLALFTIGLVVNGLGLLIIKRWEERIGPHM